MNDNFQIGIRNGVSWRLCDVGQLCRSRRAERHCRETGGSWCGRWGCGGWGSGKGIEAGDYTFRFTVEDGCENCPIDEAEEPLPLTAAEAILYGEYPIEEVFSDSCNEPLGEDFINDLAEKKDFCDDMSIIVAEAVATNSTIILMHGNISLTTLFQVR